VSVSGREGVGVRCDRCGAPPRGCLRPTLPRPTPLGLGGGRGLGRRGRGLRAETRAGGFQASAVLEALSVGRNLHGVVKVMFGKSIGVAIYVSVW